MQSLIIADSGLTTQLPASTGPNPLTMVIDFLMKVGEKIKGKIFRITQLRF